MSNTRSEAALLVAMEKRRINEERYTVSPAGGRVADPLASSDGRESWSLDIRTPQLVLLEGTLRNRARTNMILVGLDLGLRRRAESARASATGH